jgi:uncharacterized protein (DUF58 family)
MGLEYQDHRAYVPGDDPRRLDWRAVARRDRLVLRETESEDELCLMMAVDQGAAMAYGEDDGVKTRVANAIVVALALLALRQGDRVGLVLGRADTVDASLVRPLGGRARLDAIARALMRSEPTGSCPWPRIVAELAPRLPRRSLLVLLSDFLDPAATEGERAEIDMLRGLARLRARGHDVMLVQVVHTDELEFPFHSRATLRFDDPRGVRPAVEGTGPSLRAAYLSALARHLEWLARTCERDGIFLHRVVSTEPLGKGLVTMLGRLAGARTEAM